MEGKNISSLIEIESKLWKSSEIIEPNFFNNTFNMHYHDIYITDIYGDTQIIYQYHTPYWNLYLEKANRI